MDINLRVPREADRSSRLFAFGWWRNSYMEDLTFLALLHHLLSVASAATIYINNTVLAGLLQHIGANICQ